MIEQIPHISHTMQNRCEHKLQICYGCDVVYCSVCKKEWSVKYKGINIGPILPMNPGSGSPVNPLQVS